MAPCIQPSTEVISLKTFITGIKSYDLKVMNNSACHLHNLGGCKSISSTVYDLL